MLVEQTQENQGILALVLDFFKTSLKLEQLKYLEWQSNSLKKKKVVENCNSGPQQNREEEALHISHQTLQMECLLSLFRYTTGREAVSGITSDKKRKHLQKHRRHNSMFKKMSPEVISKSNHEVHRPLNFLAAEDLIANVLQLAINVLTDHKLSVFDPTPGLVEYEACRVTELSLPLLRILKRLSQLASFTAKHLRLVQFLTEEVQRFQSRCPEPELAATFAALLDVLKLPTEGESSSVQAVHDLGGVEGAESILLECGLLVIHEQLYSQKERIEHDQCLRRFEKANDGLENALGIRIRTVGNLLDEAESTPLPDRLCIFLSENACFVDHRNFFRQLELDPSILNQLVDRLIPLLQGPQDLSTLFSLEEYMLSITPLPDSSDHLNGVCTMFYGHLELSSQDTLNYFRKVILFKALHFNAQKRYFSSIGVNSSVLTCSMRPGREGLLLHQRTSTEQDFDKKNLRQPDPLPDATAHHEQQQMRMNLLGNAGKPADKQIGASVLQQQLEDQDISMIDFNQSMQVRNNNEAENVDSSASNRSGRSKPFELFIEKLSDFPEPVLDEIQLRPNPAIKPF